MYAQTVGAQNAQEWTAKATVLLNGIPSAALQDINRTTRVRLESTGTIHLESPEPFSGIYLIWDRLPAQCTLQVGKQEVLLADEGEGMLHAFVNLDALSSEATLSWSGSDGVLCDVRLFSEGELPENVQTWSPPCTRAELLVLPTHADDEHLYFGGTMPYYAANEDVHVQVAYLVNHNGEPYRPHELLDGLWTVGIRHYPIIPAFPDLYSDSLEHARTLYDEQALHGYQVGLLRRFKPLVVVGHDENGEYGHGVHRLNTDSLKQSLELARDPNAFPASVTQYGVWDVPKTYLHLYQQNALVMNWDDPLALFDGASAYEMAVKGFACHKSQQQFFVMEPSGIYDCRKFGLYRSKVGEDVEKDDFFENITLPQKMLGKRKER